MRSYLSCPIKASQSGSAPGKIVSPDCQTAAAPAGRCPPGVNSVQRPAWQTHCWGRLMMSLCLITFICVFGTGMSLSSFFPIACQRKPIMMTRIYRPKFSSCLLLLTTYHLRINKCYTEKQTSSENTVDCLSDLVVQIGDTVLWNVV